MKKKVIPFVLTVALVTAMPLSALAATSPNTKYMTSSSDISSSSSSSSTATTTETTQSKTTSDGQSLSNNGAGSQVSGVEAVFAVGSAEKSGLPSQVVSSINSINSGADLASAVGNAALEGYSALAKTAAVVLKNNSTGAEVSDKVTITMYVPNLVSGLQVQILCYENLTGNWTVIDPISVNYDNKTVTFEMYGSGTVVVVHN